MQYYHFTDSDKNKQIMSASTASNAEQGKYSYAFSGLDGALGGAQRRLEKKQTNRMLCQTLSLDIALLFEDEGEVKSALERMYLAMGDAIDDKDFARDNGASGISCFLNPERGALSFAKIGDAQLIRVRINPVDGKLSCVQLLTATHSLDNADDQRTFLARGGSMVNVDGRTCVAGGTKATTAFGLSNVPGVDVCPDTSFVEFSGQYNEYFILANAGLIEPDYGLSLDVIGSTVANAADSSAMHLSRMLVALARENGARGNLSVQLVKANELQTCTFLHLFDGINSALVADYLRDNITVQCSQALTKPLTKWKRSATKPQTQAQPQGPALLPLQQAQQAKPKKASQQPRRNPNRNARPKTLHFG